MPITRLEYHAPGILCVSCILCGLQAVPRRRELSCFPVRIYPQEDAMKAYLQNLPTRIWLLLVIPAVMLAYPVVRIVLPAVIHAVVPEAVRSVLSVI